MALTVRIDKHSCQSSGNCVEAAPEAFGFDDDGLGDVQPGASRLPRARLLEIARRCPALAITLCDEAGREIDPDAPQRG
jgi:ferredoxin